MIFPSLRYFAAAAMLLSFGSFDSNAQTRGRFPEKMTVTVVDEAGKPVTNAKGFHRFGKFVSFDVDENGIFEIPMNEEQWKKWQVTDFTVKAEGYGPFLAHFGEDPVIPETFTVVLKPAQKIGGIVVDDEGKPAKDVNVHLSIYPETAYKVSGQYVTSVDVKTDVQGRWSFFQFPATPGKFPSISLTKEGFMPLSVGNIPAYRFHPDTDGVFHETIELEKGYVFAGKVVDETGKPIEGATLQLDRDTKPIRSDHTGNFRFEHLPLDNEVLLTVQAAGKAPLVLAVQIQSDSTPLEIVMKPSRTIIVNVVDSSGKPIKGATFQVQSIDGLPGKRAVLPLLAGQFLKENNQTNEMGLFVWNDAPDTPCDMRCVLSGYLPAELSIEPGQAFNSITLYRSLVKINVVDDETDKPIPTFFCTQVGFRNAADSRPSARTMPQSGLNGTADKYLISRDCAAWQFEIEAPDYETATTRKILHGEEDVVLEVRMKRMAARTTVKTAVAETAEPQAPTTNEETESYPAAGGMIQTPDGKPAAGALVEVFVEGDYNEPVKVFADAEGVFLLSEEQRKSIGSREFILQFTHTHSVRLLAGKEFPQYNNQSKSDAEPIHLVSWGRIEGTLQAGEKKLEAVDLMLRFQKPEELPFAFRVMRSTRTQKEGRFFFEQVLPGKYTVTKSTPSSEYGWFWSTYCGTFEVLPGETTVLKIGGTGRAVIGKAVIPEAVSFRQFTARIVKKPEENIRFCVLQRDGTFRFDDLPSGEYTMVISVSDNCGMEFNAGAWHYQGTFTVDDAKEIEPMDLGDLVFEKQ